MIIPINRTLNTAVVLLKSLQVLANYFAIFNNISSVIIFISSTIIIYYAIQKVDKVFDFAYLL